MTREAITQAVLVALTDVAPEIDTTTLRTDMNLRDQTDLDSMDSLNFLIAVHEALHVDISEADWARLLTIDELVEFVTPRVPV
jgi:acyl carrier protein